MYSCFPRHWVLSVIVVFFFTLFFLSDHRTSTWQDVKSTLTAGGSSKCASTLASQVEILTTEYKKLLPGVTHVAVIGYPNYPNKGDAAIWAGEQELLRALGIQMVYTCADENDYDKTKLRTELEAHGGPSKTVIMFQGGGNFGDIWPRLQTNREQVARDFPDYRIRSFPQTYKFYHEKNLKVAQEAYGQHPDLQLTARDTRSYMAMQADFGKRHTVLLLPDAATMLINRVPPPPASREGILFLARTDGEGEQDHVKEQAEVEKLRELVDDHGKEMNVTTADWVTEDPKEAWTAANLDEQSWVRVNWAHDFLASYEMILSDRLHVHILSTVWGLDHVVVEQGSYAKLRTYHDTWLTGCGDRVAMTQSVQEGVDAVKAWYARGKHF
ncbi:hypothetical protein PV08_07776 [Exophiala spinifera]|uniref:Polysaccharide pyruvyl transferase domain-containing protein n=1 Tax=Exophiala spinifera TaxID=91928 RepID=A0A0D2BUU7_9EURO|nr:uncharacterized protein PV08_07776 [Exophiala spinifera]KIW14989.1 hypothetical protein PV08_07776 [Exophiala spinifera]